MTDLIDVVQKQDPGSGLIELFELELPEGTQYFHSGIGADAATEIKFRDKTPTDSDYVERTYTPIPIEIKGLERKTDGASSRPTLTVANVLPTFSDAIDMTNKDLIGKRLIRRTTLQKYLVDESHDSGENAPPIEFPTEKFIIDRIASENKVAITFELAAASDLEGIKLPGRIVVGKYCGWEYQGETANSRGGCIWPTNSEVTIGNNTYEAYFNIADEPIILRANLSFSAYSGGTAYNKNDWVTHGGYAWRSDAGPSDVDPAGDPTPQHTGNTPSTNSSFWTRAWPYDVWTGSGDDYVYDSDDHTYVKHSNTIWRLIRNAPVAQEPANGSKYWVRGDLCGKLLSSCKCRFQWRPAGRVTEAVVTYGHNSYSSAPTVTFSDPPAGGTTALGTATISGGVVTAISVDTPGTGYYDGVPTITIQHQAPGFAARATAVFENDQNLTTRKDTSKPMPFGAFPGSEKYR